MDIGPGLLPADLIRKAIFDRFRRHNNLLLVLVCLAALHPLVTISYQLMLMNTVPLGK